MQCKINDNFGLFNIKLVKSEKRGSAIKDKFENSE